MKHHHALCLWIALLAGCEATKPAAAEEPPAVNVDKLAAQCLECHKPRGPLDLSKQSASELRAKLGAIRAGKASHPTDMRKLTDAQLDALAAKLTAKK